jgi:hypothetical protein
MKVRNVKDFLRRENGGFRMKKTWFFAAAVVGWTLLSSIALGYSGGNGTSQAPYQIADANDLLELAADTGNYDKCFILTADIDLAGETFITAIIAPSASSSGNFQGTAFTGTFDGDGHKITNFTIDGGSNSYLGLFGYIGSRGQIKNLGLEDFTINGSVNVGGLAGYSDNSSIGNCYTSGIVSGSYNLGGLLGYNYYGSVNNCHSTGNVSGNSSSGYLGGLVGYNDTGCVVSNCYSTGNVSAGLTRIGGLVGYNGYQSFIINSYATGNVSGTYDYIGGLLGYNDNSGIIYNCYTTGSVSGNKYLGGLVGYNVGNNSINQCYSTGSIYGSSNSSHLGGLVGTGGNINNCYAIGNVSGTTYIGGIAGSAAKINHCYSTGRLTGSSYVGGLMGAGTSDNVLSSFWDKETSGKTTSVGGTGKTTAQMKDINTFLGAGWDFVSETANGTCNYWCLPADSYPMLNIFYELTPSAGNGSKESPYVIADANDLGTIWYRPAAHYVLANDIDLAGIQWSMAVVPEFWGVLDGKGFRLKNLFISGGDYLGLFGRINYSGLVRNLGIENFLVSGSSGRYYVGGFVGYISGGNINNCYVAGTVSGSSNHVGGIAGQTWNGIISNCHSSGSVTGSYYVGGMVGRNGSNISNCYSTSAVSCIFSSFGGLVGWNDDRSIINSFWDIQTSGQTISAGGTGLMTAQMQDINTFLGAGWDFINETANGTCDYWQMPEGGGYPLHSIFNGYIPAEPSGAGTKQDPYIIADANDLGVIWYRSSAYYVLGNDIDLTGIGWSMATVPQFSGVLDGKSFCIRNLSIIGGRNLGLFGQIDFDGEVKNIRLEDYSICGLSRSGDIGSLAGINYGTISNCFSMGLVSGFSNTYSAGGLIGENNGGSVSNCSVTGTVGGYYGVGGLAGGNQYSGSISNCHSTCIVSGSSAVGGLVGDNCKSSVKKCHSAGSANGSSSVGGLVGYNGYSDIGNCYSTSVVSGASENIGGLVGYNIDGSIIQCYATGSVSGDQSVGGLVGNNYNEYGSGSVNQCYATGLVSGSWCGGLVGADYEGSFIGCFWDTETSGQATSQGGTGRTTAEMKTLLTFTGARWDFAAIWAICEETNYPRLQWQIPMGDWACPDGVGVEDLDQLCSCWIEIVQSPLDINNDDAVNLSDYQLLSQYWMISGCGLCGGVDVTGDGNIDESDLTIMIEKWLLQENTDCRMTDLNTDGKMDLKDWAMFAQHWLEQI